MKKLVLSVSLAAFAVAVTARADDSAASCCSAKNASNQAKAECTMNKQAKNTCTKGDKAMRQASVKQPLKSPKATG